MLSFRRACVTPTPNQAYISSQKMSLRPIDGNFYFSFSFLTFFLFAGFIFTNGLISAPADSTVDLHSFSHLELIWNSANIAQKLVKKKKEAYYNY